MPVNVMQKLNVAIDPGFDSMKVIANGKAFKFPFSVIRTDESNQQDMRIQSNRILYTSPKGITYRVGEFARAKAYEEKGLLDTEMESFYSAARFEGDSFRVGLDTAIGMAIEMNGLYDFMDSLDIRLVIALPHSMRLRFVGTVAEKITGESEFSLQLGRGPMKPYHIQIDSVNLITVSQTIAAIVGETSDEYGCIDEEKEFYLTEGPTMVLDGGYYTVGVVPVMDGGNVDERWTLSDTDHAMKNINMRIVDELRPFRPDIRHYTIEYLLNRNNGIHRFMKDGRIQVFDLKQIREEKIREVCGEFMEFLMSRYNNLLDYRYVLVTGGTGACFYPYMLEYVKEIGLMDEKNFLLTTSRLEGQELSIEYAIAVGAYKGLRGKMGG